MPRKQADKAQSTGQHKPAAGGTAAGNQAGAPSMQGTGPKPALPPADGRPPCDPHCVDVTGHPPEDIRIDPDITEGHPGYQESGNSEIIPPDRLAGKEPDGGKSRGA